MKKTFTVQLVNTDSRFSFAQDGEEITGFYKVYVGAAQNDFDGQGIQDYRLP